MARRRNYGQFTPRRKAALKRAQLISAQKRHRRRKTAKRVVTVGVLTTVGVGAVVGGHKLTGSHFSAKIHQPIGPNASAGVNLSQHEGTHLLHVRPVGGKAALRVQYRFGPPQSGFPTATKREPERVGPLAFVDTSTKRDEGMWDLSKAGTADSRIVGRTQGPFPPLTRRFRGRDRRRAQVLIPIGSRDRRLGD